MVVRTPSASHVSSHNDRALRTTVRQQSSPVSDMDLLTINDVAAILKVSKSLVYGMIASGKIACHRIGNGRGAVRVRRDDLEHFINQCRVGPSLPPVRSQRPKLKHLRIK
jgi:excisionase family DNA binding protein